MPNGGHRGQVAALISIPVDHRQLPH